jgi:hypothetical protein
VIYIDRSEYGFLEHAVEPLTEQQMQMICLEMQLFARADDAHHRIYKYAESRSIEFRFWWD